MVALCGYPYHGEIPTLDLPGKFHRNVTFGLDLNALAAELEFWVHRAVEYEVRAVSVEC